jgi:peptidyl-prolyl cis-trans isomerase SurA
MNNRILRLALALSAGAFALAALAQGPAPGPRPAPTPPPPLRNETPTIALDRVVAVVNDEALTSFEIDQSKRSTLQQMKEAKVQPPPADVLEKQVIERLITERALMQYAKESGVRVDDTTVERTILRVAQDNKLTPEEFRKVLERENIPYAKYREEVRKEVIIQRLREREVDNKVYVSDAEVDQYLATVAAQAGGETEYLLSHVLVRVPEQASPDQIDGRRRRAEQALADIKKGTEFSQVAASFSDAPDALQGGSLGWRTPARLPTIFGEVVRGMKNEDVSGVLRSAAGFHIVKLVDSRSRNAPTVIEQTRARHILIKVNEIVSETEGKTRIDRIRDRLLTGAKFEDQAKTLSEDASSAKGGDLGWLSPGDTVPDFEQAMAKLKLDEISPAVRSPFGWHLIQVQERRKQDITLERQRSQARLALQQRKSDEAFQEFVRQTRDRAFVEYKSEER